MTVRDNLGQRAARHTSENIQWCDAPLALISLCGPVIPNEVRDLYPVLCGPVIPNEVRDLYPVLCGPVIPNEVRDLYLVLCGPVIPNEVRDLSPVDHSSFLKQKYQSRQRMSPRL